MRMHIENQIKYSHRFRNNEHRIIHRLVLAFCFDQSVFFFHQCILAEYIYWNILIGFCTRLPIKSCQFDNKNYCCFLPLTNRINRGQLDLFVWRLFLWPLIRYSLSSVGIPPYWWDRLCHQCFSIRKNSSKEKRKKATTTEKTKTYTKK